MGQEETISVAKPDLIEAWSVLEDLAVSLDQIGSLHGIRSGESNGERARRSMLDALSAYLTPTRVQAINKARILLGAYLPQDELADLAQRKIPYWNCAERDTQVSQSGK